MTTEVSAQPCSCSELHNGHICELESQQEWDILKQVTGHPSVKCENCGAQADSSRNVCMPVDL